MINFEHRAKKQSCLGFVIHSQKSVTHKAVGEQPPPKTVIESQLIETW